MKSETLGEMEYPNWIISPPPLLSLFPSEFTHSYVCVSGMPVSLCYVQITDLSVLSLFIADKAIIKLHSWSHTA